MCRVENSVIEGMPDTEGCLKGIQFWIELKTEARPVRQTTLIKPRFEPGQLPWIKSRIEAGGKAFIFLQVGSGAKAGRYLIPGQCGILVAAGMTEEQLTKISIANPLKAKAHDIINACFEYIFYI